ncbi:glycosyltransferase family 15 protein [Gigaspora margarita]|uniref:Glycosyltransferase family 15 protein n=1 Tax=Gigaspora margarita TaxID=4874 RepID=A0A8H4EHH3_GIGMA|nr:glycosyltransferase family 15 protein [Gigaspora margarita]
MYSIILLEIELSITSRQRFFESQYIDPMKDTSLFLKNVSRVNAVIIVLVRNKELHELRETMRYFEDRWNKKYNYPYVFLNDEEFTQEFKILTKQMTHSETYYGLIPKEMWDYPPWINQTKAAEIRKEMEDQKIIYGGSESYRHMCRFNSGFFFRHELIQKYDYYWRLEPDQAGGFYYERWGDAPVHSIALAMFLEKSQIHFFNDIAYMHPPFQHCPIEEWFHESDDEWGSCTKNWFAI